MPSDQVPNQTTSPSPADLGPIPRPVSLDDVNKSLKRGFASPLDFIKQNGPQPEPRLDPQAVSNAAQVENDKTLASEIPVQPTEPPKTEVPKSEPATVTEPDAAAPAVEEGEPNVEKDAVAINFKKLRTKVVETTKALEEKDKEVTTLKTKVEEYETGKAVPDVVAEKDREIERLSRFEKLHSLKTSKEFNQKFVTPLNETRSKIMEIAKDYSIPENVMDQALNIQDRREFARFLSNHFEDVDALEVKKLVDSASQIRAAAKEAELEPERALANLQAEYNQANEVVREQKLDRLSSLVRDSWVKASDRIAKEGKAIELIEREGDSEHNDKIVKPLRTKAATEYGRIVTELVQNGLEEMPEELGVALATMVQLAIASGVSIASRDAVYRELQEVANNSKRTSGLVRPPLGGGYGRSSGGNTKPPSEVTLKEAAQGLLNTVLSKGR